MLLVNPSTYIAAVLFLAVMGFVFTTLLSDFSSNVQENSPAYMFFQNYMIPVLFMVPLLTMRCLAEERRLGTIETLLTTPVSTRSLDKSKPVTRSGMMPGTGSSGLPVDTVVKPPLTGRYQVWL